MLLTRRQWIAATALSGAAAAAKAPFVKSICSVIFPPGEPLDSMFSRARQAGFAGIELRLGPDVPMDSTDAALGRIRSLSRDSGVAIASLWVSQPLSRHPLNSPEAGIREQGVADIRRATEIAAAVGCGALLLVPGRVGNGPQLFAGYEETWKRITDELGKCIPAAAANKTLLTVENVWNKFLVSPLEMRAFVDQFHSPWLAAHFDMGNVMQFGYPEDWVHILGPRIRRVHVKDYKLSSRAEQGRFVPLLDGDVNFAAVFRALRETAYSGFLSPEIDYDPARPDQLAEVAAKLDRILTM
ncbi:MAG TPA: sugar phosphate isomerase/epimerase family protein [Bryobacteraceae bacterium]|nr:sugar phosphate isomerase/epimerase family protein [Bryobacteraceae bacterium]